jgi:hypothetical protein
MDATFEVNAPTYAHAILTTGAVFSAFASS